MANIDLDKIKSVLKIENLDEAALGEFQTFVSEMVDLKAKELATKAVEPIIAEAKQEMETDLEGKFDEYKKDLASNLSNFVDGVLEEQIEIPQIVTEFARKGRLYSDLIDQFKLRIGIDEAAVNEEARTLLAEALEKIESLKKELNEATAKNLEIKSDAKKLATALYAYKKTEGLTESQRSQALVLLEGIDDVKTIDEKFAFFESYMLNEHSSAENKGNEENAGKGVTENLNEDASKGKENQPPAPKSGDDVLMSFWAKELKKD